MGIKDRLSLLRLLAMLEGISFLLFAVTMPLKYMWQIRMPNVIVGFAHGWLFIAYVVLCLMAIVKYRWRPYISVSVLLASLIPFGTFIADAKVFKQTQKERYS
jgi:integral membrane protein